MFQIVTLMSKPVPKRYTKGGTGNNGQRNPGAGPEVRRRYMKMDEIVSIENSARPMLETTMIDSRLDDQMKTSASMA